jgi:hypothetical protein
MVAIASIALQGSKAVLEKLLAVQGHWEGGHVEARQKVSDDARVLERAIRARDAVTLAAA